MVVWRVQALEEMHKRDSLKRGRSGERTKEAEDEEMLQEREKKTKRVHETEEGEGEKV